jgi:hypothetical protein
LYGYLRRTFVTKRSDTLAAQVAALDMVMAAIDEGRDMRAFVGGMMRAAIEQRNAALEAETKIGPVEAEGIALGLFRPRWENSDEDTVNGTDDWIEAMTDGAMTARHGGLEVVTPRCDLCGEAWEDGGEGEDWNGDTGNHRSCEDDKRRNATLEAQAYAAWDGLGRPPTRAMREQAHDVGGPLYEEDEDDTDLPIPDFLKPDPFRNAISVRAAYAFGDWPPKR